MEKIVVMFAAIAVFVYLAARFAKWRILGPRADRMPAKGDLWRLRGDEKGPWPSKQYSPVRVLDVQSGWVRYDLLGDSRLKVDDFTRMYRPEPPND